MARRTSPAVAALTAWKGKALGAALVVALGLAAMAGLLLPALAGQKAAEQPQAGGEEDWLRRWGQVIDPDADSRFRATRTSLTVTVPAAPRVFAPERGRSNAPRVVREVQGDFLAQIDPRPYQAALDQVQGQLARDEALLAAAKIDLARYEKLMEAFGGVGVVAATPAELKSAMEEALRSRRPTLINAMIDEKAGTESGRITSLNPSAKKKST